MEKTVRLIKVFVIIALVKCLTFSQPLLYQENALTQTNFFSFGEQCFGSEDLFQVKRLSPYDLQICLNQYKAKLQTAINGSLIGSLLSIVLNKPETAIYNSLSANGIIGGVWGICATTLDASDNDNLFLIVDNSYKKIIAMDFLNSSNMFNGNALERQFANMFFGDVSKLKLPTITMYGSASNEKLVDPRGICTDNNCHFWVADMGGNKIIHLQYDKTNHAIVYKGSINGFYLPNDVAFCKGEGVYLNKPLLVIANTGANGISIIDPYFEGEKSYSELPNDKKEAIYRVFDGESRLQLFQPNGVATNTKNSNVLNVICCGANILEFERSGDYKIDYTGLKAIWPLSGRLSCIKSDNDGNLICLDDVNCLLGKYTQDLQLIFTTGGLWENSMIENEKIRFNHPKYLSISKQSDNLFVSENWWWYSGVQRFSYYPRFIDKTVYFQLNCSNQSEMEFHFGLTKAGKVKLQLLDASDNDKNIFEKVETDTKTGDNVYKYAFPGQDHHEYRAVFTAYDASNETSSSDNVTYWLKLEDPQISDLSISPKYFNSAISSRLYHNQPMIRLLVFR